MHAGSLEAESSGSDEVNVGCAACGIAGEEERRLLGRGETCWFKLYCSLGAAKNRLLRVLDRV